MANESITFRKIGVEDLELSATPGDTFQAVVWGAGTQTLTKIPLTLLTQLVAAANDSAAATAGVLVGQCYFNTTHSALWTRMS